VVVSTLTRVAVFITFASDGGGVLMVSCARRALVWVRTPDERRSENRAETECTWISMRMME
jgi:hypothetical protein